MSLSLSEARKSFPDLPDGDVILIADDDAAFRRTMARALESRGFRTVVAEGAEDARRAIQEHAPPFAVVDLRLEDGYGLDLVGAVRAKRPEARVIILTGYGAIATAVAAVKAGAVDYLSKPADADDVMAALVARPGDLPPPPENPISADRIRWEHIQRVYELCGHNVSETARRLNMHRRTLQRILAKRAPQEGVTLQER